MRDLYGTDFEDYEELARWTKGRVQRHGSWHSHVEGVCFDKSDMMIIWQQEFDVRPEQSEAMYETLLQDSLVNEQFASMGSSMLGKFRSVLGGRAGQRAGEYKCTIVLY